MAKNYSYPRVTMSTVAKKHSNRRVSVPDTTILFAPLWTEKGPDDRVVKVHSINEFIDVFGSFNEDFYNYNGQQALNVYNWLNNGGTLLVKRLIIAGDAVAETRQNYTVYKVTDKLAVIRNDSVTTIIEVTTDEQEVGDTFKYDNKEYRYSSSKSTYEVQGDGSATSLDVETRYTPIIKAKYHGSFYGDLKVTLKYRNNEHFDIIISQVVDSTVVNIEKHVDRTLKNYLTALSNSEYIDIDGLDFTEYVNAMVTDTEHKSLEFDLVSQEIKYSYTKTCDAIEEFFTNSNTTTNNYGLLLNHLETPIDLILDAGYPVDIKNAIGAFVRNNNVDTAIRPDIVAIFDSYVLGGRLVKPTDAASLSLHGDSVVQANNIALYKQYFTVNDAVFTQQNIYVTPTYFLASLIPYNDRVYGIQYPTAGLTRGLLVDVLSVNENPDPDTKEAWFQARTNYAERTSKETAFMTQRTNDGSTDYDYTALSFLNNIRVLERMKKDLESIGRSYLHEFNDATTLANMSSALNKYISTWIANRTLSLGGVEVAQNEISENALDINLTIRFTNTIEVINVSIVIE